MLCILKVIYVGICTYGIDVYLSGGFQNVFKNHFWNSLKTTSEKYAVSCLKFLIKVPLLKVLKANDGINLLW